MSAIALAGVLVVACADDPEPTAVVTTGVNSDAPSPSSTEGAVPGTSPRTAPEVDEPAVVASTSTEPVAPTVAPVATIAEEQPDEVTAADLARFVAATESAIEGTASAGLVLEAPEIYVALAQAACARFTEGASFDEIANGMLAELGPDPTADDERLVGAVIGAATRTICPEHADRV